MDDFEKELKTSFLDEATQLLADVEQCFLVLEANPDDFSTLEKIFRLAHNLKGSAKAVGFDGLGSFTHELETFLLKMKTGKIAVNSSSVGLLLQCNDLVVAMVQALRLDFSAFTDSSELTSKLQNHVNQGDLQDAEGTLPPPDGHNENFVEDLTPEETHAVDIYQNKLESSESVTPILQQRAAPKNPVQSTGDESIRVSLARVEKLLNYVGEIVILQTVLREQASLASSALLQKTVQQMGKVTKEVQDLSMSLRMIPLKQTFQKMQRIVRDTSAGLGKKVTLTIEGEDTEIDKPILESLSDPLVHLIRNAVDHGIELPETRIASGKSECGTIRLIAKHQSGNLVIEIADDGAGMSADKLRKKAVDKGILKTESGISDQDAYQLIFHPGFSTKEIVTDVSGRGVGMDVVRTNIDQLQGDIQIETVAGKGTTFRVELPLTLAIIDGMVVSCGKERYVVPLAHVHESLRPSSDDVHFISGVGEILSLRGEQIPLVRLNLIFHPQSKISPLEHATAIVVRTESKPFAVLVDEIIGQQQVVIKQLGSEHSNLQGLCGSAILGDGRPALILELSELVKKSKPTVMNQFLNPTDGEQRRAA